MTCTKPSGDSQSSWVVEDDISLATMTCIPAQAPNIEMINPEVIIISFS